MTTKQKAAFLLSIKEILTVLLLPSVRRWQARRHQPVPSGLPAVRVQTSPVGASHWLPPAPEEHHDSAQKQTQVKRDGEERKEKPLHLHDAFWLDPTQGMLSSSFYLCKGRRRATASRSDHEGVTPHLRSEALLSQPDAFCRLLQIWTRLTWWRCKATYVKKKKKGGMSWQSERAQILGGEVIMLQNKLFGKS